MKDYWYYYKAMFRLVYLQYNIGLDIYTQCVAWRSGRVRWFEPHQSPRCFLEYDFLPLLLSTVWFPERFWAWFHNQTNINWEPCGRL